ncbi:MAG TPA: TIGR02281 family clan AA aspartic protease [Allosphingosinicella sp.]|nr:TIGR02281 family clan AA aspartic protease [Allosphingosinicella sp.]
MIRPFFVMAVVGVGIGALMPSGTPNSARSAEPEDSAAALVSPTEPLRELVINRRSDGHFYTAGLVNGREARFLIDTGATHIALTMDDAKELGIDVDPSQFEFVGEGAGGAVRGQVVMLDRVSIGGRVVTNAPAMVLEGLNVNLLGQSVLSQIGTLEITRDRLVVR